MLGAIAFSIGCNKHRKRLIEMRDQLIFDEYFSYILENAFRTLTGRKFLSAVLSCSPLSKGQTDVRFPFSGN